MERRLVAIMAGDVVGYSAQMGAAEADTLARLARAREVVGNRVEKKVGRIFSQAGDGYLAEFPSPVSAVRAGFDIQRDLASLRRHDGGVLELRIRAGSGGSGGGATYCLEGSVRTLGSRIRITGQLISTKTGEHVWADSHDCSLDDLFDVQDEIVDQSSRLLWAAWSWTPPPMPEARSPRIWRPTTASCGACNSIGSVA